MVIYWYSGAHHRKSCNISSMDDVQKYDENELFCLRIRKDILLCGGILGEFKTVEARNKAYDDIKDAFDAGREEFDFRAGYYLH